MKKLVIINFKAYYNSTGINALKLARIFKKAVKKDVEIFVAVQPADISSVSKIIKTLAQHIDNIGYGPFTGHVLPENIRQNRAVGTLLNHSEKRLNFNTLKRSIQRAKEVGLLTIVCAATPKEARKVSILKPDFIAIEPPELIGGNISVSRAKPELITKTTSSIKNIPILCGAGIKNKEDVAKAVKLGVRGILVASGVVNAKNPEKALKELINGF